MEIKHHWSGNNTSEDFVGTSALSWEGTPEYEENAFKLISSGGQSINKLILPSMVITSGTPFMFEGSIYVDSARAFPHICTPENGNGQDATHGLNLIFDFVEGFFQTSINGKDGGYAQWLYGLYPTTYQNWHTFKIVYNGGTSWSMIINDVEIPRTTTFGDFVEFNGLLSSPPMTLINWADFGDSYLLIKDLKFSM